MNLIKIFTKNEIELIENTGINVEDKDCTKDDIKRYEMHIGEFIMSHSTKNGDIGRLTNKYNSILNTFSNKEL